MLTYAYGFPRLGRNREYKKLIESYWNKEFSAAQLKEGLQQLEQTRQAAYSEYVDKFAGGEMTYYDNMLDTAFMLGLYDFKNPDGYYDLCRGENALGMKKWFNTNYHYLLPEIPESVTFKRGWDKATEFSEPAQNAVPYFIGPFTFLKLAKGETKNLTSEKISALSEIYFEIIKDLNEVHIDEPAFVMELSNEEISLIKKAYSKISANKNVMLFTYYSSVDFLKELFEVPLKGIGLDFANSSENLETVKRLGFPKDKILVAGLVNGRNVWKNNIAKSVETLKELSGYAKNLIVSNAAPLYHLPLTVKSETGLDPELKNRLAFAEEKLYELKLIARVYDGQAATEAETYFKTSDQSWTNPAVRSRMSKLSDSDFIKQTPLAERRKIQDNILNLPLLPTTTIGSFPQTKEIRAKRLQFRKGILSKEEYSDFIRQEIRKAVQLQEEIGLDVFVHGEFERTDMVEYFAEKMDGIATTKNGWIISYGTRGYRPPIIYGDVSRPAPMTIDEIAYAQSLTAKPVKGMLTGAITIISWSFVREDIPTKDVAYQISLCIQDEIRDYEKAGIKIVQIDEPALREKAPIKKREWAEYFDWAIKSFNLGSQSKPETQIHTHMCYSEFGEIIEKIDQLDFDKITIEASKSRGDVIVSFEKINCKRQIGLGVWDIHSIKIPAVEEMENIVDRALKVIPKENFWINPDCGLKTRNWDEVIPALKNMVEVAKRKREKTGL